MSEGESGAHWSRGQGMGCQGRCLLSPTPIQTLLPTLHSDEDKNHKGSQNHWILNILTLQSSFTMQKIEGSEDHLSWVMVAQKRDKRIGCKHLPAWVLFRPPVGGGGSVGAQSNQAERKTLWTHKSMGSMPHCGGNNRLTCREGGPKTTTKWEEYMTHLCSKGAKRTMVSLIFLLHATFPGREPGTNSWVCLHSGWKPGSVLERRTCIPNRARMEIHCFSQKILLREEKWSWGPA